MNSNCAKPKSPSKNIVTDCSQYFQMSNLRQTGRLQFFFHSPLSEHPIRDLTNEQGHGHKTEPHIEERAENFCSECYQSNNIVPFLKSDEKYLFLFTTCKNPSMDKFYKHRYIVGYIVKEKALLRRKGSHTHWAVQGETKLYSFSDAYPLTKMTNPDSAKHIRIRTLSSRETVDILQHFKGKRNVLKNCLQELKRLGATVR